MAGDWIKIEKDLPVKGKVLQIADTLGVSRFEVVGLLVVFWSWVDSQMSAECPQTYGHLSAIDGIVGRTGFGQALIDVGWLRVKGRMIEIPGYDEHLEMSAKKRAEDAKRKRLTRSASHRQQDTDSTECPENVRKTADKKRTREEKRRVREENSTQDTTSPLPPKGEVIDWPERIYQAYPRKVGKPRALAAIRRATKDTAPEALLALVEQYAEAVQGKDEQFIPHPSTFFNDKRYADDPQSWNPASKGTDLFGGIREFLKAGEQGDERSFWERQSGGGEVPGLSGGSDWEAADAGDSGGVL